jgi:Family of unknown function (DUF6328)
MRKLVITQNTTLDGSVEMTDDWFHPRLQDDDVLEESHRQDSQADALLVGGRSRSGRASRCCATPRECRRSRHRDRPDCQNDLVGDIEHPEAQKKWDPDRDETEAQRLDRNWSGLLQELRVAQTGVQLLTGFLLTLPFQQRFAQLDATMKTIYLITVGCSIGATVLLVAPVSMHRLLFRRHRLKTLVAAAHTYAMVGLVLLGTALAGVAVVIFDTVVGRTGAWISGGGTLLAVAAFWYLTPLLGRGDKDNLY